MALRARSKASFIATQSLLCFFYLCGVSLFYWEIINPGWLRHTKAKLSFSLRRLYVIVVLVFNLI